MISVKKKKTSKIVERIMNYSGAKEEYGPEVRRIVEENNDSQERVSTLCNYIQKLAEEGDINFYGLLDGVKEYAKEKRVGFFGRNIEDIEELGKEILLNKGFIPEYAEKKAKDVSHNYLCKRVEKKLGEIAYSKFLDKELERLGEITQQNYEEINDVVQKCFDGIDYYGIHLPQLEKRLQETTKITHYIWKKDLTEKAKKDSQILETLVDYFLRCEEPSKKKRRSFPF